MDKKQKMKRQTQFEGHWRYHLDSCAIRQTQPKTLMDFSEEAYKNGLMNRKEELRHIYIMDTMMFQRIAKTGQDTYEELGAGYDEDFGRKSLRNKEIIVENNKTNLIILKQAGIAGQQRTN